MDPQCCHFAGRYVHRCHQYGRPSYAAGGSPCPPRRKNKTLGAIFRQGNTLALLEQNYAVWQVRLQLMWLTPAHDWQRCAGLGWHRACKLGFWSAQLQPHLSAHLPSPQALHKASDGAEVDLVAAVNRMAMDADKAEAAVAGGPRVVIGCECEPSVWQRLGGWAAAQALLECEGSTACASRGAWMMSLLLHAYLRLYSPPPPLQMAAATTRCRKMRRRMRQRQVAAPAARGGGEARPAKASRSRHAGQCSVPCWNMLAV